MSYDEYADEAAYQEQMAAYANEVEAQLEDEYRADLEEQLKDMTDEERAVWLQRLKSSDPTAPPDEPYIGPSKGLFQLMPDGAFAEDYEKRLREERMRRDVEILDDFDEKAAAFDKLMTEYGMTPEEGEFHSTPAPSAEFKRAAQKSKGLFQNIVFDDSLPPNTFKIGDFLFEMKSGSAVAASLTPEQKKALADYEERYVVGERVRYIGTEFDATHGGQVGTVMQADGLAGLKWVQFDDDLVAPQGWFPAKDLESYVPTKIVEDPDMPVGGGVFYSPEQFAKRYDENVQGWFKERAGQWPIESGPDPEEHPTQTHSPCPKCGKLMSVSLDVDETPIWWCVECDEKYPRFLDGMSTPEEIDAEVKHAAKVNDVELMLMRWRYGSDEQQKIAAREIAALIVRRLS